LACFLAAHLFLDVSFVYLLASVHIAALFSWAANQFQVMQEPLVQTSGQL
jgi:hypothetical protein